MKIADSHYTPYRPASGRQSAGFDQAQSGLSMPVGRPDTLHPDTGGGTNRSVASGEAEAIVFTDYSMTNLSAAFWAISADKLEKRDADGEKATQAATARAADKAATRDEFMDWAGKSTAEKIRAQILKDRNLSEEDLAKMDPAERKALEAEITETVKRQLGLDDKTVENTGASAQNAAMREGRA